MKVVNTTEEDSKIESDMILGIGVVVGVDSEIEVSLVVGDDRTEFIGTGMEVVKTTEDEDSGTESDVAIGIGVVAATEVVKITLDEDSNMEVENKMKVVDTVDSEIEVSVFVGDDRREIVGTVMKVVNTAEDEDSKIENVVLLGIGVVVGTDAVEVTLDENSDMELEAVVVVKTEGSKMGAVVGDGGIEAVSTRMEIVDSEIEVSGGDEVVGAGLEVINTTEDENSGAESDVAIGIGVVVGAEVIEVTLDENSDVDISIEIKVVGIMETVDSKMEI